MGVRKGAFCFPSGCIMLAPAVALDFPLRKLVIPAEKYYDKPMNREISLDTAWAGTKTYIYDTIDSTNEEARRYAQAATTDFHGVLFVSEEQTAGKGRRGRVWESPKGGNLYCTLLLKPECPLDAAPRLTLLMGLAVAEAVRDVTGLDALIKWPNDVVVQGRKICGILTEMDLSPVRDIFIGLGINIAKREYPEELKDKAADLESLLGSVPSKDDLLLHVMKNFEIIYDKFIEAGDLTPIREQYQRLLVNMDRRVRVLDPQGEYEGKAIGIDKDGQLLVAQDDGSVTTVFAGEVSVRGVLGYV